MTGAGIPFNIGDVFPNFTAQTTFGPIDFHKWISGTWAVLFSHPADYTPVCTTEMVRLVKLLPEFVTRDCKVIALSIDSVESHKGWIEDILKVAEKPSLDFPVIADESREIAYKLNMLDKDELGKDGIPLTCRAVYIIDDRQKLRASICYPATTGRNFDEILRVIDSLQLTDKHSVATPADWKDGDACMVLPTVKQEDVAKLFPAGVEVIPVPSGKTYLRKTPQP
ncbi:peroxiredoxin-6 [Eurosta solidaginis]|uniref:peroxiredoxin-6 n=1 Tax=Eurosta solidaginis TaxID=178769 RepID=UPI0035310382